MVLAGRLMVALRVGASRLLLLVGRPTPGNAQHATITRIRTKSVIAHTTTGDAVSVVVVVERFMTRISAAQTRAAMKEVYGTP